MPQVRQGCQPEQHPHAGTGALAPEELRQPHVELAGTPRRQLDAVRPPAQVPRAAPVPDLLLQVPARRAAVEVPDARGVVIRLPVAGRHDAVAEVEVLARRERERLVEAGHGPERVSAVRDVVARHHEPVARGVAEVPAQELEVHLPAHGRHVVGVRVEAAAAERGLVRRGERALELREPVRLGHAVVVGEREELPFRRARARVPRARRSAVRRVEQRERQPAPQPVVDLRERRRAAVVDDDQLPVGVLEAREALEAPPQRVGPVVRRDDHAEAHHALARRAFSVKKPATIAHWETTISSESRTRRVAAGLRNG